MVNKTRVTLLCIVILSLILLSQAHAGLLINEFMAINGNFPVASPGELDDWIELYNDSNEVLDVAGFYLTDDLSNPTMWQFPTDRPSDTTMSPHGFLLIIADEDGDAPGLHANFKLAATGEQIALFDADGQRLLDSVTYGEQQVNMSYGRDSQDLMVWRFLVWPSPGFGNLPGYLGTVEDPVFSSERGFYEDPFSVTLTCQTPDVDISYTTDGSDPLQGPSSDVRVYQSPILVNKTLCVRAVAYKPGWLPSKVVSHTYLYRMNSRYKSLPVISLVGSADQTFYAPNGIMAIVGGTFSSGVWTPTTPGSYNNVLENGLERPVSLEFMNPESGETYQTDCGIRVHGSDWMRPRYQNGSKFSFRLYFRSEYGVKELDYPFFPFDTKPLKTMVLRAGHNDISNPFIKDELVRRLLKDMGHVSSRGTFANVFINGQYKGYYNPCEHINEAFCQGWFNSDLDWDIITMFGGLREGDRTRINTLMQYVRTHDMSMAENYAEVERQVDIVEFIDYLILRLWSGDWDWPHNNWSAASERSDDGKWRFFVWDAEGSMFPDRLGTVAYSALHNNDHENSILYNALFRSPQFKALFGDRLQKHFNNEGVLTEAHIRERFVNMQEELRGVIPNMDTYVIDGWVPQRRSIFMDASKQEGVFTFEGPISYINSRFETEGHVQPGDLLYLINPNTEDTIYYTKDGSDPREHAQINEWESIPLFLSNAPKRVLVPTGDVDSSWTGSSHFDDSHWLSTSGLPGGVGYERSSGYESYISLDVNSRMQANTSCYMRIPFLASRGVGSFDQLTLRIQYDDGFVAYLNGQEVARRNAPDTLAWNSAASASHNDAEATVFETIDLTAFLPKMLRAENVFAIQGLNVSTSSSDFLMNVELTVGRGTPIQIDEDLLASDGPVTLTEAVHLKARILRDNIWSTLTEIKFAMQPVVEGLRISELMYHPFDTGGSEDPNTEYIELTNVLDQPISLGLIRFTEGIQCDLPAIELAPYEAVLVVKDKTAFEHRYGLNLPVIAQYTGSLSNSGEWIELRDITDRIIQRFQYRDDWIDATDGEGYSLTVIHPAQSEPETLSDKTLWRASAVLGGTPGWVE